MDAHLGSTPEAGHGMRPTGMSSARTARRRSAALVATVAVTGSMLWLGATTASATTASAATASAAMATTSPSYVATIGGPGHAQIYPSGLDVGSDGTLYVADTGNDQVAAFDSSGTQLWRRGFRGPNYKALGRFSNPRDLAYLEGRLYVADLANNRVQVLDATTGEALRAWTYRFPSVIGISAGVDAAGRPVVLTTDDVVQAVQVFDPDGTLLRSVGSGPASGTCPTHPCAPGVLNGPRDAATDSTGNVYVADYANDRMAKFSPTGQFIKNWGTKGAGAGQFGRPYGVAVGGDGGVYVADSNNGRIQKFSTEGTYLSSYGSKGEQTPVGAPEAAPTRSMRTLRPRSASGATASDRMTGRVTGRRPSSLGSTASRPTRSAQQPYTPGQFFGLRRVAVGPGPTPDVFGADLWDFRVERFTQTGTHVRTYGNVKAALGGLNEAYGVAADATSTFVMDTDNQRVQRFDTAGRPELAWGERGFGDGNPGFNWARDITIASATGTLWVADTKNNRLQEFSREGAATGRTMGRFGTTSGPGILWWPHAVQAYGTRVLVANTNLNRVELWDPASKSESPTGAPIPGGQVWSSTGSPDVPFLNPKDVTVVGDIVYVADSLNGRIVRLNALDGSFIDSFGSGTLHRTEGVAVAPDGTVWTADTSFNRLVQFGPGGSVLQVVGSSGSAHGQFNNPTHLEIRAVGTTVELLVVDTWNDRVEVFDITADADPRG